MGEESARIDNVITHTEIDIQLIRRWFSERSSIGELFYPAASRLSQCFILEDVARAPEVKIAGATCIAAGDYFIKITFSNRFKRLLPLIYNEKYYKDEHGVEHFDCIRFGSVVFDGVRIHPGNDAEDTEACQLPGQAKSKDIVYESRKAFDALYQKIFDAIGTNKELRYRIVNLQAK